MAKFIIGLINLIIKALGTVLNLLFSILPPSPFQLISNTEVGSFLDGLAWVIPIPQIIAITQAWLIAIGAYYLIQIVLRWVKAID